MQTDDFLSFHNLGSEQMSLDCNRLAFPNPLWLNLVGTGSIAIFWTILGLSTQPAQANQPEQQQRQSEILFLAQPPTPTANHEDALTQPPMPEKGASFSQRDAPIASVSVITLAPTVAEQEEKQPLTEDRIQGDLEPQDTSQNRCDDKTCGLVNSSRANLTVAQLPYPSLAPAPIPVPAGPIPSSGGSNSRLGQLPYLQQPQISVPIPPPAGFNNNISQGGQQGYYPQMMLVPAPANGMGPQMGYPQGGQQGYYPQMMMLVPVPANGMGPQMGYPQGGQQGYYPQMMMPVPANGMGPQMGYPQMGQPMGVTLSQPMGYPQMVQPLPPPLVPNQTGFNGYPQMQQPMGYPQMGQPMGYPQMPVAPNPGFNNYPQPVGQNPYYPQPVGQNPYYPPTNLVQPVPAPTTPQNQQQSLLRSTALTAPSLQLQGTYINQGDLSSARARLAALYPLTPQVQFGATLDLTSEANSFADSRGQGLNVNELYVAAAPFTGLPNLRFVAGQLDLTSYFDRNSFAKDGASQFFNPVFQTNPALSATGIASRPGALVNWTLTDNIEAKAAVFSSSRSLSDFSLDGFAGEIGFRYGNAIVRGSFVSDRDAGSRDGFREIFGVRRADGGTGIRSADRENAYGVNAEYFVPKLNMGLFARYGRYDNQALKVGGDTYSLGVSFFDVISKDDRLGLAYGRNLSNNLLRQVAKADVPDVLELFYDFRFLPNLRLGFTLQQRNGFEDTYAGFRVKTDFDLTPRGRLTQ